MNPTAPRKTSPLGRHHPIAEAAGDRPATDAPVAHVLIIHEVQAYAAWKQVFDAAQALRRQAGEVSFQLLREEHDANSVVHFSRWSSLLAAREFFESAELIALRHQAGVKAPTFIYLQELERGVL